MNKWNSGGFFFECILVTIVSKIALRKAKSPRPSQLMQCVKHRGSSSFNLRWFAHTSAHVVKSIYAKIISTYSFVQLFKLLGFRDVNVVPPVSTLIGMVMFGNLEIA